MSELYAHGVRLDKLLAMEPGQIFDAVPEAERTDFRYWRGIHLGKIALNLMQGNKIINAGTDNIVHFIDDYYPAREYARAESRIRGKRSPLTQWNQKDAECFEALVGVQAPDHFAGAVIALARNFNNIPLQQSNFGMGHGGIMHASVTIEHSIDSYSRRAFEDLFEMDFHTPPKSQLAPGVFSQLKPKHNFGNYNLHAGNESGLMDRSIEYWESDTL